MNPKLAYGKGRRSIPRGPIVALLIAALVLAAGAGIWAKGRGYRYRVMQHLFPHSRYAMHHPSVRGVRPTDHEGSVSPYAFIACDLILPNSGQVVDGSSLDGGVRLFRTHDGEEVPSRFNTTGGGDAIVLRPIDPLRLNTEYTFEVLPAVHDTGGLSFEHFTTSFTTAAGTSFTRFPAAAMKVPLPLTQLPTKIPGVKRLSKYVPSYTCVTTGPDGKLYASTSDGRIFRFPLHADGTVDAPELIDTVRKNNDGDRLLIGLRFDPASAPAELILWVSHGQAMSTTQDEWTGKITRLSGPNLETYQDWVVGLPRAKADHATDQIDFGPDGCLYFNQASNTAMGAPDHEWGYRPEQLLTASVMRLDLKLVKNLPLNARTDDGGEYSPFNSDSPLTLYATGVRNGYDLVWHSNGNLYVTVNGSAAGGNAPGTPVDHVFPRRTDADQSGPYAGPDVTALKNLPTQGDFLLRIEKGGYYGHPNPTRSEYIINGGNPTGRRDICGVPQYPIGTQPDRNWRHPVYDFGKNLAPCGLIEYKGNAFPALRGKLLIARYSGGKDVFVMGLSATGEVSETFAGLEGFTSFYDPLDLCEDPGTGYLYVAEFGGRCITLLRPVPGGVSNRVIREGLPTRATTTATAAITAYGQ